MSFPAFIGRYAVEREIASGGFAAVVLARDEELEVPVTLKILHANLASNEKVIGHFLEEARLLRRIRSPRVVSVHHVGRLEDGRPYFVMELVRGQSITKFCDSKGRPFGLPDFQAPVSQHLRSN